MGNTYSAMYTMGNMLFLHRFHPRVYYNNPIYSNRDDILFA